MKIINSLRQPLLAAFVAWLMISSPLTIGSEDDTAEFNMQDSSPVIASSAVVEADVEAVEGTKSAEELRQQLFEASGAGMNEAEKLLAGPEVQLAALTPAVQPPLALLGSTVEPGEAALLKWSFEATFLENSTPVPVLVVNGTTPGPTLCLTAAVHGDELNGIEVVRRIVHDIEAQTLSGAIIGVPIVNLQGFQRASRYLPDRRDLNRYFPGRVDGSYASRVAHSFFNGVIKHCDYLIDIHTGSLDRTNLPQIRANLLIPEVATLAEKMGSIVVLQSTGSVGTLRRAAAEAGIPAVTLEAGAPNNLQKDAVEEGFKSVLSAMSSLGLSPKQFRKRNQEPVYYQSKWIRARQGGILFSKLELGDAVKKGDVLGLISDPISNKTTEIIAPIEGRVIGMALNQVMYPGFAAYHIGLKSSAVDAAQPQELVADIDADESESVVSVIDSEQPNEAIIEREGLKPEPSAAEPEKLPIEEMELPTIDAD